MGLAVDLLLYNKHIELEEIKGFVKSYKEMYARFQTYKITWSRGWNRDS